MDVILGNCLLGVLDLTLCRSLNSKSEKYIESATMPWSEPHFFAYLTCRRKLRSKSLLNLFI
jgi:hypothetical protein